jgi:hypothetical protein
LRAGEIIGPATRLSTSIAANATPKPFFGGQTIQEVSHKSAESGPSWRAPKSSDADGGQLNPKLSPSRNRRIERGDKLEALQAVFKELYTSFLLRDFAGKIVPGCFLLFSYALIFSSPREIIKGVTGKLSIVLIF